MTKIAKGSLSSKGMCFFGVLSSEQNENMADVEYRSFYSCSIKQNGPNAESSSLISLFISCSAMFTMDIIGIIKLR